MSKMLFIHLMILQIYWRLQALFLPVMIIYLQYDWGWQHTVTAVLFILMPKKQQTYTKMNTFDYTALHQVPIWTMYCIRRQRASENRQQSTLLLPFKVVLHSIAVRNNPTKQKLAAKNGTERDSFLSILQATRIKLWKPC